MPGGSAALPGWQEWRQGLRCLVVLRGPRRRTISLPLAGTADFGPSRFGRWPGDPPSYTGRRADFLGRSLPAPADADPAGVLRDYLSAARTASAKELAAKAVILITPEHAVGGRVWPQ